MHGKRVAVYRDREGQVLDGPATQPLAPVDLGEGTVPRAVGVEAEK